MSKINIKVKVLFRTGDMEVKFSINENDVFSPLEPFVVEDLDVRQFQALMGIIINIKRWLESFNGKSIEIEVEEP